MPQLKGLNSKALKAGDPEPAPLPAGHARVYSMRFCPWAERAIIYLAKKEIPVEVVNINLQQKPEWYFKKHPEGKVPAFELDGKVVIESGQIPEYLDNIFPESSILPADPYLRYQQKLLVEQLSSLSTSFYGVVAAWKDSSIKEEKFAAAEKAFKTAEDLLHDVYFAGSSAGYADYLWYPFFERFWLSSLRGATPFPADGFPGAKYPKLSNWFKQIHNAPETTAASQSIETHKKFLESYIAGQPDYDAGI